MFIIKKKNIIIITLILIIILLMTSVIINKQNKETVDTVSFPVSNKVIVLDAGHGVPDEGAESSNRNYRSRDKFENYSKSPAFIRTKWSDGYFNQK